MILTPKNIFEKMGGNCRIFDGKGREWDDLFWLDTETGRGKQFRKDSRGVFQRTWNGREVLWSWQALPLPIRLELVKGLQ